MDLRWHNLLGIEKFGIGHGLPVTFEDHHSLPSIPQVIVVYTVVWKKV